MGRFIFRNTTFIALFAIFASGFVLAQANEDMVTVIDGHQYNVAYYKSSIKSLPPDWKKVWTITNRKQDSGSTPERVQSIRRNILFNCVRNTYSTLATVNYSEPNAMGKPNLQTETGFELNDDPVPEGTPLAIIYSQVCGS
ncbi:surface-adhesin E family protein [Polynucleobacter sp. MWH-UH2A]|uniref:surface-adhesin E family protein n=1 Tax=Polynucleobacter sp. MWH-UH2A TaxID=1855617 RepID=UPI001BFEBFB1|nr:surface-adhesin E family protein [Polynucleobacter sp. MWH-UH2A]